MNDINEFRIPYVGEYIMDAIIDLDLTIEEFSNKTHIDKETLNDILCEHKRINAEVANKLGTFFNQSPMLWLNLDNAYLKLKEEREEALLDIEREKIFKLFDKKFIKNVLGYSINKSNVKETILRIEKILKLNSLDDLRKKDYICLYKTPRNKDTSENETILKNTWISFAKFESKKLVAKKFDKQKLIESIPQIKQFMFLEENEYMKKLTSLFLEVGIKFVKIPYLANSNISGASIYDKDEDVIILAINNFGKSNDKFWFTLFHELSHIIKDHLNNEALDIDEELEADNLAMDLLIDKNHYEELKKRSSAINGLTILKFSKDEGVPAFIVVSRLQHDKLVPYSRFNEFKSIIE